MTDDVPSNDSYVRLTAFAPVSIGKKAEPRVTQSVTEILTASGHQVSRVTSQDSRGEDAKLQIGPHIYTLSTTGVPHAPPFWAGVSRGSGDTDATLKSLGAWLAGGIDAKFDEVSPAERARTIIALDGHDWAEHLVAPAVIDQLNAQGLNPAQQKGLAGIAIVGRDSSCSTWLPGTLT